MSVYKRGPVWQIEFVYQGRRYRRTAGRAASKADAQDIEREMRRELKRHGRLAPAKTFDDALIEYLPTVAATLRDRGFDNHLKHTRKYIAGRPLSEGLDAATELVIDQRKAGLKDSTIDRRLANIKRLLHYAFDKGWIAEPLHQRIKFLAPDNERFVAVTPEEVEALAAACTNAGVARAIRIAAYTGMRRGELLRLSPHHLHVEIQLTAPGEPPKERWFIRLERTDTKSKKERVIPIPEQLRHLFTQLPIEGFTPKLLQVHFDLARKAIGREDLHFHDLRHAYGTWLGDSGVGQFVVQTLMGHRDPRMTQRYVNLTPTHEHIEAVARLKIPDTAAPSAPSADDASVPRDSERT